MNTAVKPKPKSVEMQMGTQCETSGRAVYAMQNKAIGINGAPNMA
jgi:hypothetical protein